jgi:predicted Zn finger-like uncharacterized protein
MFVTCEKCQSEFILSDAEIEKVDGEGRILKCGNCHHMWLVKKDGASEFLDFLTHKPSEVLLMNKIREQNYAHTLQDLAVDHSIDDYYAKSSGAPLSLKIMTYSLIFFFGLTLSVIFKNPIVGTLPVLKPFFWIVGLHDTNGLVLEKIKISKNSFKDGKPLIISGYINNKSLKKRKIPDLKVSFLDEFGNVSKTIVYNLPYRAILPNEKGKISQRIKEYPKNTENINVEIGNFLEFFTR